MIITAADINISFLQPNHITTMRTDVKRFLDKLKGRKHVVVVTPPPVPKWKEAVSAVSMAFEEFVKTGTVLVLPMHTETYVALYSNERDTNRA